MRPRLTRDTRRHDLVPALRDAQPPRARQGGLTLIGLAIATALLVVVVAGFATEFARYERQQAADRNGQALAQMATGLTAYIDAVQSGSVHLLGNPQVENGFAWLKPPTCGGLAGNPTAGFVPCTFDPGADSAFFVTTVSTLPVTGTTQAVVMLCAGPNPVRPSLAGTCAGPSANTQGRQRMLLQAAFIANAALANAPPHDSGFVSAFSNTPPGAPTQYTPQQVVSGNPLTQGLVTLVVNDNPSQDPFLRVDGSNHMLADLNVGGHNIANADGGTFSGTVAATDGTFSGDVNASGSVNATVVNVSSSGGINDHGSLGVAGAAAITTLGVNGATTLRGPTAAESGLTVNGTAGNAMGISNGLIVNGNTAITNELVDHDTYNGASQMFVSNLISGQNVRFLTGAASYTVARPTCQPGATPEISASMKDTGAGYPSPGINDYSVAIGGSGPWTVYPMQQPMSYTVTGQLTPTGSLNGSLNPTAQGWRAAPSMQIMSMTWCAG